MASTAHVVDSLSELIGAGSIDRLIKEARDRQRRRRRRWIVLAIAIAVAVAVAASLYGRFGRGGGTSGSAVEHSSPASISGVGSECGTGVPGRGFRVFACESGGAQSGHGHPKELLVIRADGSSAAYPAFRLGGFAEGDGEVVATYNVGLVRVTGSRLIPLLGNGEVARALGIPRWAIMDVYATRVDARGNVYFVASVLREPGWHATHPNTARSGPGCRNTLLERTADGAIRQIRASTAPNHICS